MEAVAQGSQIQCNAKQYPAIRAALITASETKGGPQEAVLASSAMSEIERLDLLFANNPSEQNSCGTAAPGCGG